MLTIFDYIFYRVTRFYKLSWGASNPAFFGFAFVWALHAVTFSDLVALFGAIAGASYLPYLKPSIAVMTVIVFPLDYYRYSRVIRMEDVESRWGLEPVNTRRWRGWLIALHAIVSFGFPFVFGTMNKTHHWIK